MFQINDKKGIWSWVNFSQLHDSDESIFLNSSKTEPSLPILGRVRWGDSIVLGQLSDSQRTKSDISSDTDVVVDANSKLHKEEDKNTAFLQGSNEKDAPLHWKGWEVTAIGEQTSDVPDNNVMVVSDFRTVVARATSKDGDSTSPPDYFETSKKKKLASDNETLIEGQRSNITTKTACHEKYEATDFFMKLNSVKEALDHWEVEEEFPSDFLNYSHDEMEVTAEIVVDGSVKRIMGGLVDLSLIPDNYLVLDSDNRAALHTEILAKAINQRQQFTDFCQSPWLLLRNSGDSDTGILPLRWSAVILDDDFKTDYQESSEQQSSGMNLNKNSIWQALRCKTYTMPVKNTYIKSKSFSRVVEVERWVMFEASESDSIEHDNEESLGFPQPHGFFIQKKIRTRDTPLCSAYYVEYSVRITPRGADQCLIQTAWAPVWLAYVGPLQKTITRQIKKGILFNSSENLHLIASKVAHWNIKKNTSGGREHSVAKADHGAAYKDNKITSTAHGEDENEENEDDRINDDETVRATASPVVKNNLAVQNFLSQQRNDNILTAPEWNNTGKESPKMEFPALKCVEQTIMKEDAVTKSPTSDISKKKINSTNTATTGESYSDDNFEERLIQFYTEKNPAKLQHVKTLVRRFKGREDALFKVLIAQYGESSGESELNVNKVEARRKKDSDENDLATSKEQRHVNSLFSSSRNPETNFSELINE